MLNLTMYRLFSFLIFNTDVADAISLSESCQLFKYLLEKRITHSSEINERDLHGDTLLHLLIKQNIIDLPHGSALLNLLITYGYDVSLLDAEGHTADQYLPAGHPARDPISKYRSYRKFTNRRPRWYKIYSSWLQ